MANRVYTGAAVGVAEVVRLTVGGTIAVGNTFTVTIGTKSLTFTATTTVVADAVAGILALIQADNAPPEFSELDWTSTSTYVQATGPDDGYPIADGISVSKAQGAGGTNSHTFTETTSTTGTGPEFWSNTENWLGGAVPTNNDTVILGLYNACPKYDITTSLTGINLQVHSGAFPGLMIGLPEMNENGWPEYLGRYLQLNFGTGGCLYGLGTGSFVPKMNLLDVSATARTHTFYRSDRRDGGTDRAPVQMLTADASTDAGVNINCLGAKIDFNAEDGQTYATQQLGTVRVGTGGDFRYYGAERIVTIEVLEGGNLDYLAAEGSGPSTIRVQGGGVARFAREGAASILYVDAGGVCHWNRVGTLTFADVSGSLIFSEDERSGKVVTDVTLNAGATLDDREGVATFTNPVVLNRCGIEDVTIQVGKHKTLAIAAGS